MATDETPVFKFVNPPGTGAIIRNDGGDAGGGGTRDVIDFEQSGTEAFSVDSSGLPDPGGGDPKRQVIVCIGDIAADSDALQNYLWQPQATCTVTNIYICVNADTADGTTNKQIITVKREVDDGAVATFTTAAANPGLADETWTTLGAITNASIVADDYLYCTYTKTVGGLAMAGLTFLIEYTLGT